MQTTLKRITLLAAVVAIGALAWLAPGSGPLAHLGLTGDDSALSGLLFAGLTVNRSTLDTVFNGLKTLFNNALVAQTGTWQETAMEVPSSGAGGDYAWLNRFPKFKKWVGDKVIKNIVAGKYFVKNEDWETTIAIARNDLEDDRLGIYNIQARSAGASAGELHDIIVDSLKSGGFTQLCYDGQYFYDTDHVVAGANVSNKLAVALSGATTAAALASYGAARTAIMSFKEDEGMPLRLIPDVLEVPPALESMARLIIESGKFTDQSPNPYKGTARIVSTRRVKAITEQLCGFEVSSTQVSQATALLDEQLQAWRERPLGRMKYLYLDARYEKVRQEGQVRDAAVLVAVGVNQEANQKC